MCKILARHWALRKIWSTKFPLGGGEPYPASGIADLLALVCDV